MDNSSAPKNPARPKQPAPQAGAASQPGSASQHGQISPSGHTSQSGPDGPVTWVALGLEELRAVRRDAQEQEADLSYLRRILQGRVDILRAELDGRTEARAPLTGPDGGSDPLSGRPSPGRSPLAGRPLLERLPEILADAPSRIRSSARHVTLGPPRGVEFQQQADALMGDVRLADLPKHASTVLTTALNRLCAHEREVSHRRLALQRTADECSAEITRRYREGEARVDDLLAGE